MLSLSLAFTCVSAGAAAPMVTDDAAVIDPRTCQLEVWFEGARSGRTDWIVPACNVTGNLELSLGYAGQHVAGDGSSRVAGLQAKSVLAGDGSSGWALGVAAGGGVVAGQGGATRQTRYFGRALLSLYPLDWLEVDFNAGADDASGTGAVATVGGALQLTLGPRTTAFAEVFRDERGPGKYQVGLTVELAAQRVAVFASYGAGLTLGLASRWWSTLGIRINTAPLLP
jgi:hypothetical protein